MFIPCHGLSFLGVTQKSVTLNKITPLIIIDKVLKHFEMNNSIMYDTLFAGKLS